MFYSAIPIFHVFALQLYLRGKLLFANYILTGDGCSRDLQNQVAKSRREYRLGQFLPPDFKFR